MAYEIEEKQFESAANGELWRNPPTLFTPGQVLENLLGFDLAGTPDCTNKIWSLLNSGVPAGIQLTPNLWPIGAQPRPAQLPRFAVSLILQYKRSEYFAANAWQAAQHSHWKQAYYRYGLSQNQHSTLLQLEAAVNTLAVTRYAAPAFHTYAELELYQLAQQVLDNSNFVSPTAIGATHRTWSFISPGGLGWANPEGEEIRSDRWTDVSAATDRSDARTSLAEHLAKMAEAVIRIRLSQRVDVPQTISFEGGRRVDDAARIAAVINLCHVARAVSLVGGSWWLSLSGGNKETS